MKKFIFFLFILLLGYSIILSQSTATEKSITERVAARDFPSIFQAWGQDDINIVPKHDLLFTSSNFFKLKWNNQYIGLATEFTPESIRQGLQKRQLLLDKNPNMVFLMELRHKDTYKNYLPADSNFWLKKSNGEYEYAAYGSSDQNSRIQLDPHNPELRKILIKQCAAAVNSGVFDGIMLDWWSESTDKDPDKLELLKGIREAIGPDKLIIVNANDHKIPNSAPYINGLFMECYKANKDNSNWKTISEVLLWAEANLREPRINCLETWFAKSRNDLDRMRATTTLALTHSNGYALFSDPNNLPTPDHLHDWYSFWDAPLGKPSDKGFKRNDNMWQREFTNGTVIYNPIDNFQRTITFKERRTRVSDGSIDTSFTIKNMDGDIFLYTKAN